MEKRQIDVFFNTPLYFYNFLPLFRGYKLTKIKRLYVFSIGIIDITLYSSEMTHNGSSKNTHHGRLPKLRNTK